VPSSIARQYSTHTDYITTEQLPDMPHMPDPTRTLRLFWY